MNLKVILMAAGAFVVGLGSSTAAVVMRTHAPAVTAAAQPASDSLAHKAHAAAIADTTTPATTNATPLATQPVPAPHAPAAAVVAGASVGPNATPVLPAADATLAEETPAGYRQIARVLSSMKPADAAKIAAFLTDDQVEGILGQLGVRQAASLMSQLPTERAAALSRRIMKHTEAK